MTPGASRIAIALSGGSDSMAALHLLAQVRAGVELFAVTVDHGLRAEAAAEALFAGEACARLQVPHDVLAWAHGDIRGNLMERAREARYALMAQWSASKGISTVVLGHTADDQAETFLMGLGRAAGLDGLVGMRAQFGQAGVTFVRPFLGVARADLRDYLTRRGVAWVDDPTNDDPHFARTRARTALRILQPLGITVDRIVVTIGNLRAEREELRRRVVEKGAAMARIVAGEVRLDRHIWQCESAAMQRRMLVEALAWVTRAGHPPRAATLSRALASICLGTDTTLGGCRVRCLRDEIRIVREPKAVRDLICGTGDIWDARWRLERLARAACADAAPGHAAPGPAGLLRNPALSTARGSDDGAANGRLTVSALGEGGLALCKDWRDTGASRDALVVSPAVWDGVGLVAAPLAGVANGWDARIVAPTAPFEVSH